MIHSPAEYKIIRLFINKRQTSAQFWIGGSSSESGPRGSIELFEYQTKSTGKKGPKIHLYVQKIKYHVNPYANLTS